VFVNLDNIYIVQSDSESESKSITGNATQKYNNNKYSKWKRNMMTKMKKKKKRKSRKCSSK